MAKSTAQLFVTCSCTAVVNAKELFTEGLVGLGSYVSASVGRDQLVERGRLVEPDTEVLKYILRKLIMCVCVCGCWTDLAWV